MISEAVGYVARRLKRGRKTIAGAIYGNHPDAVSFWLSAAHFGLPTLARDAESANCPALAFMSAFYERLSQGQCCRSAVALAQRELYERQLHPYSWASFILVGAPEVRFPATSFDHAAVTREVTP